MKQQQTGWVRTPITGDEATSAPDAPAAIDPETPEAPAAPLRTFIDGGADFDGTLRLACSLRIDSEFKGAIESEATVVVGEAAGVEADIRAREVIICGAVVGNVVATRQLILRSGGRLHGDVETPCLEIEKHAFFNGRTTMMRPEAALRAGVATHSPAAAPSTPPANV
jgi:cytoskeletal protein CcmA (bactofilin family)